MSTFLDQIGPTPPSTPPGGQSRADFRTNKAAILAFIQRQVAAAQPIQIPNPTYSQAPLVIPTAPLLFFHFSTFQHVSAHFSAFQFSTFQQIST